MTKTRKILGLFISFGLLAAVFLAWNQKQSIYDWYRLRGYEPSAVVSQLATDTTMNNSARKVFYINRPAIEGKTDFNAHCPQSEHSIVLGCYVKNKGIYIFNVTDKRLRGIKQVTAAHELLHAEYDRLDKDKRTEINNLIVETYEKLKNERIRKNISAYKRAGADELNELHSILGTEVRELPNKLEKYYKNYFDNRIKIVKYSEKYESYFTELKELAAQIETEIKSLKDKIGALTAELGQQRAKLESDRANIKDQGDANAFNARVIEYNSSLSELNELISKHNALVSKHQQTIVEQKQLFKAIDAQTDTFR